MTQQSMNFFNEAELALAAYASLIPGATRNQSARLIDAGMASRQADEFANRFPEVVTQFNDTLTEGGMGTGFSATVFRDASGNLTLAIRGTEFNDLATDANIAANGAGYDQIVAMYNWWTREASPAGQMVQQYQLVGYAPTATLPTDGVFLYSGPGVLFFLQPAAAVVATGELVPALGSDADHRVDITGHSLGAHLSLAFNTLFSSATNQVIGFDTPGFTNTTTNQQFFALLGGQVPNSTNSSNVTSGRCSRA